jgi:IclR family transcriptional regulator, KDG regulon repressor
LTSGSKQALSSVNRALDVLEAFTEENPRWGLSSLSRELDIGKPTLHRLLKSLQERGYVRQDPTTKQYLLGLRTLQIGRAALAETPTEAAHPHLRELSRLTGEQTTLWVLEGSDAVCVAKVAGRHALRAHTDLGAREPAHLLAAGRCLLAFRPIEEVRAIVGDSAEALASRFAAIRDHGFDLSRGERWPEISAAAAPVRDHHGEVVASAALSAPTSHFSAEALERAAEGIVGTADAIAVDLGAPMPAAPSTENRPGHFADQRGTIGPKSLDR